MSTISESYINNIVSKIASNLELKDWNYATTQLDTIGQNYFGLIIPVTLTAYNRNCKCPESQKITKGFDTEVIKLILKLAPTDERYRVSGAIGIMFLREIYVYTKIFTLYHELQRQIPVSSQFVIPRILYTDSENCSEVIAMEDLTSNSYFPFVNRMFLDLPHVTESLKAVARLHALSFILKVENSRMFDEISDVCIPLSEKSNKRFFVILNDRLDKAIIKFKGTEHVALLEKLKSLCYNFYVKANELATCICHMDIWKENVLFKYEDNKPISCCLIDYQTTRMASPAYDALYLIITSTNSELRNQHYQQLLDIYYQTFSQCLKSKGLDSQSLYSSQNFANDLKVVAPACLITANVALWLSNGLQQEGHVISKKKFTTPQEIEEASNIYVSVLGSIIDDFYKYGYLPCEFC